MNIYTARVKTGFTRDHRGRLDPDSGEYLDALAYVDIQDSVQINADTQVFVETRHALFFQPGAHVTALNPGDVVTVDGLPDFWTVAGRPAHNQIGVKFTRVEITQDEAQV